jgi:hypothetical protein
MRMAFEFKKEFHRSRNSPLSTTINIDRSTFPEFTGKLGKFNEGGALVHARGRTWGQLIFLRFSSVKGVPEKCPHVALRKTAAM